MYFGEGLAEKTNQKINTLYFIFKFEYTHTRKYVLHVEWWDSCFWLNDKQKFYHLIGFAPNLSPFVDFVPFLLLFALYFGTCKNHAQNQFFEHSIQFGRGGRRTNLISNGNDIISESNLKSSNKMYGKIAYQTIYL